MIDEQFKNKIRWKIFNKKFQSIDNFEYSGFKFKFHIKDQKLQEEFANLICDTENLMPWDICNFFTERNIKFSISYRYIFDASIKSNFDLFKIFLYLKKQIIKRHINKFLSNYKIKFDTFDRMNNNKMRKEYLIQLFNFKKKIIYFVQWDSNIWWIPKKIYKNENIDSELISYGWLFAQFGRMKIKK